MVCSTIPWLLSARGHCRGLVSGLSTHEHRLWEQQGLADGQAHDHSDHTEREDQVGREEPILRLHVDLVDRCGRALLDKERVRDVRLDVGMDEEGDSQLHIGHKPSEHATERPARQLSLCFCLEHFFGFNFKQIYQSIPTRFADFDKFKK